MSKGVCPFQWKLTNPSCDTACAWYDSHAKRCCVYSISMHLDSLKYCEERLAKIEKTLKGISFQMDPDYYPLEKFVIESYSEKIETIARRIIEDHDQREEKAYYIALLHSVYDEMREKGDLDEIRKACQCYSMSSFHQKTLYAIQKVLDQSSLFWVDLSGVCVLQKPNKDD